MDYKKILQKQFEETNTQYLKNLYGHNYTYAKQSLDLAFQILDKINEIGDSK